MDRSRLDTYPVHRCSRLRNLHPFGDFDPLLNAIVMRLHKAALPFDHELAYNGGVRAAKNFEDGSVRFAVAFDAHHSRDHTIAMHRAADAVGGNKEIAAHDVGPVVRN